MNPVAAIDLKIASSLDRPLLTVVLREQSKAPVLAREPVTPADMAPATSETWRELVLRKGRPHVPYPGPPAKLIPIFQTDTLCSGFALEIEQADAPPARCEFSNRSLRPVAERASRRLVETGVLKPGQQYIYEVVYDQRPAPSSLKRADDSFAVAIKTPPLHFLSVPLRELLRQARPENSVEDGVFPVFYTAAAYAKAERCARKGGAANPPVETGSILAGTLCSCPETGEFFCVVTEAMEVVDAEEKTFSLSYTSRSWTRIQTVMKTRQAVQPALRILGQGHGHNFVPNDGKICEPCLKRPVCNLTNLFASPDDEAWTSAVFAHQPWQLCHIFGLSARGDKLNRLYGLHDALLRGRGFFVLPEFDPAQWEKQPANRSS